MGSWLERFYGCCSSADWCWWPNSRKYNPAAASGSDDDDDALIELGGTGNQLFESNNGRIAILSRGQIKYVKGGVSSHTGSSHIGIPIIDPLIGQDYNVTTDRHHHQRQLFTQLHQHARFLVNKNIFHWQHQQTHHHQWWWKDSSTPPSSVDLEWEHEGLMPPVMESASEDGGVDPEEDEADYDTPDEEQQHCGGLKKAKRADQSAGRNSPNDPAIHRSPSPSSACHSLEWDSNGDDFYATDCRPHNMKSCQTIPAYGMQEN